MRQSKSGRSRRTGGSCGGAMARLLFGALFFSFYLSPCDHPPLQYPSSPKSTGLIKSTVFYIRRRILSHKLLLASTRRFTKKSCTSCAEAHKTNQHLESETWHVEAHQLPVGYLEPS